MNSRTNCEAGRCADAASARKSSRKSDSSFRVKTASLGIWRLIVMIMTIPCHYLFFSKHFQRLLPQNAEAGDPAGGDGKNGGRKYRERGAEIVGVPGDFHPVQQYAGEQVSEDDADGSR